MSVGGFDIGGLVSDFGGDFFTDFATDFAGDFLSDFAGDLALDTFVDGFGTEFLTDIGSSFMDFGGDLFSGAGEFFGDIGGSLYEQVGSFAGSADWFNATSFGSILDSAGAGISEFFGDVTGSLSGITNYLPSSVSDVVAKLPSLPTSIPALSSVVSGATGLSPNLVTTALKTVTPVASSIIGNAVGVNPALVNNILSTGSVPIGSIVGGATGINPNLIPGISGGGIQLPSLGSIVTGASGINPNIVPGIGGGGISLGSILSTPSFGSNTGYGTPGIVPTGGFNIGSSLNSALAFVTGSGSAQAQTRFNVKAQQLGIDPFANAVNIDITGVGINLGNTIAQDPSRVTSTGGNFTEFYNSETGLYDVFNNDTGETVQTGLNQQAAILAAQDLSIGNAGQDLSERANNVNPANFPAYDDEGNLLPG